MSEDRPGTGAPRDGLSEEQVTQLLAAAGATEPTPPDVAARLDSVLADLVADRGADGAPAAGREANAVASEGDVRTAPVVPMSERRRRRTWAPRLLVAAAVLGLVGIGFSVADDLAGGSASSESATAGDAAGSSSEESGAGSDSGPQAERSEAGGGAGSGRDDDALSEELQAPEAAAETMRLPEVLRITGTASLRAAVRVTGDAGDAGDRGDRGDTDLSQESDPRVGALDSRRNALTSASVACVVPRRPGSRTLVTYQGSPATLVVRRVGERWDGRVYDCDLGLQLDGVEIGPPGE